MKRSRTILLAAIVATAGLLSLVTSDDSPSRGAVVSFHVRTSHCRISAAAPPLRVRIDCS
jgi:hypothetical protein